MTSGRLLLRNIYHLVTGDGPPASATDPRPIDKEGARGNRRRGVDLLIDGGRVSDIGVGLPAGSANVIDCATKLVLPGMVNTHHHMCQTLQRNVPAVQNAKLFDWLVNLYPIWRHLTAEGLTIATQLACGELLKTGCTTTSDHHYLYPREITDDLVGVQVAAAKKLGIRFCVTRGSMSLGESGGGLPPDSVVQDEEVILASCDDVISAYHDASALSMTRVALAPCAPFNVSLDLMRNTAELARKRGVRLHTHLAETLDEETFCLEHYGKRPLALMEDLGWLGDDVWYAHGIHFDDRELEILARTGTGVAHCPSSNMRLGSGICRVPDMMRAGVPVGLGVDGSASNDSSDMMGELRSCLFAHRVIGGADAITAEQVLSLATAGSAKLLGWPELGRIAVGQAADLVLVEMNRVDYAGALSDPLAAIMFCGVSHGVHTTIVNGEIVVKDGALVNIDEDALRDEANAIARHMLDAAGHDTSWFL